MNAPAHLQMHPAKRKDRADAAGVVAAVVAVVEEVPADQADMIGRLQTLSRYPPNRSPTTTPNRWSLPSSRLRPMLNSRWSRTISRHRLLRPGKSCLSPCRCRLCFPVNRFQNTVAVMLLRPRLLRSTKKRLRTRRLPASSRPLWSRGRRRHGMAAKCFPVSRSPATSVRAIHSHAENFSSPAAEVRPIADADSRTSACRRNTRPCR